MIYQWQTETLRDVLARRPEAGGGGLPHALLLSGRSGLGKADFADHLAQALLCESKDLSAQPCGTCPACQWFSQGNHPDFLRVRPESLDEEAGEKAEEGKDAEEGGKSKTLSQETKIEQVRRLIEAVGVPPHRAGMRVILLYPVEALNLPAANALLKTLEEPPSRTLFLLVTDKIERVMPTILSRCQVLTLPAPGRAEALQWLAAQGGVADAALAADLLDEAGGAPLAALRAAGGEDLEARQFWLGQLEKGPGLDWLGAAEAMQKTPMPRILDWTQRWAHDLLSLQLAERPRFYPARRAALEKCAAAAGQPALWDFAQALKERRRTERHPLGAKVQLETLLLEYRQLFVKPAKPAQPA
ncbi:MAG: DNA polymerase III subunit delta' [Candidatus Protistobacter heckmanni]|nr:DNA polymerase III subunit delta' [Candidatus Protistobacter heckmanni]